MTLITMVGYAFDELNLHRVYANLLSIIKQVENSMQGAVIRKKEYYVKVYINVISIRVYYSYVF